MIRVALCYHTFHCEQVDNCLMCQFISHYGWWKVRMFTV